MNSSDVALRGLGNPALFLSCHFVGPLAALRVDPDPELQVWHRRTRGRSDGFEQPRLKRPDRHVVSCATPGATLHGASPASTRTNTTELNGTN